MKDAFDQRGQALINADRAVPWRLYRCPHCLAEVSLHRGRVYAAHFRHRDASPQCPEYYPGFSGATGSAANAKREVDLPLWLSLQGRAWSLHVEVPEITAGEAVRFELDLLPTCMVILRRTDGQEGRIGAGDLWPGEGGNLLQVEPSVLDSALSAAGPWPPTVEKGRWHRNLGGMRAAGTVFGREKGGNFRRVDKGRPVFRGQEAVVVAMYPGTPPTAASPLRLDSVPADGGQWLAWQVTIPDEPSIQVDGWLKELSIEVRERAASTRVLTPPTCFEDGVAVFDTAQVLLVQVPRRATNLLAESGGHYAWVDNLRPDGALVEVGGALGAVQLRSDARQDRVEARLTPSPSVQPGGIPPLWQLGWGERQVLPHSSGTWDSRDIEITVRCDLAGVRFNARATAPGGAVPPLDRAHAPELQRWLRRATENADEVEVDAGALGSVRMVFAPAPPASAAGSDSSPGRADSRWQDAYQLAAERTTTAGVPHWRTATRTMIARRGGWRP